MITVERLLKVVLAAFLGLLLMLQFLSFPGQFRYMAEHEPENAEWRWPLTILVFFIILAIEICVIALWKIIDVLSHQGSLEKQLRLVNLSIVAMTFIWFVLLAAWAGLLSVANDPGLPVVVTVILCGVTVALLLYAFYRKLLLRHVGA